MSSYYYPVYSNELYHFGTKRHSGRYPWGSGDRPYQSTGGMGPGGRAPMTKEEAIRGGSAKEVLRYKGQLTNQELQTAVTRLNLERQLESIDSNARKRGESKAKKVLSLIGDKIVIPLAIGATTVVVKKEIDEFMQGYYGDAYNTPKVQTFLKQLYQDLFIGVNKYNKK